MAGMSAAAVLSDTEATSEGRWFELIRRDLQRYFELEGRSPNPGPLERFRILLNTPGLHAVLVYRFGSWTNAMVPAPFRYPLKVLHFFLHTLCIAVWGIHIDEHARIGPGLYIGHFSGVVIGPVQMGSDCNIAHNVTIGGRVDGKRGFPTLGDQVWIGTGSVVFGEVQVGDGVTIGPLTVVSHSLAPRVLVMGNPMKVMRKDYDNSTELYGRSRELA